jgi:serine/threonine protein kinase
MWDQLANNRQRTQQDIAEFFSNVTLKLIDFGVSKANTTDELSTTVAGSYYIMAPEIRMNQPYNEKVDIYSLGVIYNILLTGKLPFKQTLEIPLDK